MAGVLIWFMHPTSLKYLFAVGMKIDRLNM
jgi:hypothetical protein